MIYNVHDSFNFDDPVFSTGGGVFEYDNDNNINKINIQNLDVVQNGNKAIVLIGKGCRFFGKNRFVLGENSRIIINPTRWKIRNLHISCVNRGCLYIGHDFSCHGVDIDISGPHEVLIGNDVQMSKEIIIRNHDGHPIFQDGVLINHSRDIIIGDHVWIGQRASILKGANILRGSVVGFSSVVTKKFSEECVVLAGNPARIVKERITWSRDLISSYEK